MAADFCYQPPTDDIEIIHQDDDILVVNKPAGLLSVPGRLPEHKDSLVSRMQQQWPKTLTVHRLDMETSGVVVFALNKAAQSHMARQFQERKTHKTYIARIWGHPETDSGQVDVPLICDWPNRPKQKVCHEHGKQATTGWQTLQREENTTLVELNPITGRSHQLRVHMLHMGHVIVGDRFYAQGDALSFAERLHLHSQALQLSHPVSGETLSFESIAPFVGT